MTVQLGARHRQRVSLVDPNLVLGTQTITVDGQNAGTNIAKVPYWGVQQYDFSLLESCWDELHQREEVVKYYVKLPGKRRIYLSPEESVTAKADPRFTGSLYAKVGHGRYFSSGGPFCLIRTNRLDEFVVKGKGLYRKTSGPYSITYDGGFLPTGFSNFGPSATDLYYGHASGSWSVDALQAGMEQLGAQAWNRARPKTSSSDILTFLGELHELPQMLKTTAKGFNDVWRSVGGSKRALSMADVPKSVSDQFLNHAFGWAPFVGDIKNFYDTYQNLDRNVKQMLRDNGKWVKRGVRVDRSASMHNQVVQSETLPWVTPTLHDWLYSPRGNAVGRTETFVESYLDTWFVGSFKYFVPRPPDNPHTKNYNRVMDAARQFGVRLSPSAVWNLTPWSWLADYFGNLGDIISNIDAQNNDNLTARYAYIMRHMRERYVIDATIYLVGGDVRVSWAREIESKVRVEASPFGFGLTGGGLSPYRIAILSALGLSKA